MSRLTRDGTAEPVSRDPFLRHARGQGNIHFPCSADHEQDWQPYSVDPYSAICDDHTYIHTYILSPPPILLWQAFGRKSLTNKEGPKKIPGVWVFRPRGVGVSGYRFCPVTNGTLLKNYKLQYFTCRRYCKEYFKYARFIPIVGVGKRGAR